MVPRGAVQKAFVGILIGPGSEDEVIDLPGYALCGRVLFPQDAGTIDAEQDVDT